jgi:glycerol-3-phosphate dehydrogenase
MSQLPTKPKPWKSPMTRMQRDFTALAKQPFDVLVCGGGIYGAWTAYDAALRGLKVAIVEQGDWASATSSASSKLIHGGLRYLESLDLKLVQKALHERQMLLQAAPHRVWPIRFGIPVSAEGRLNRFKLKIGLMLYDFLAGSLNSNQAHRYFTQSEFAERFPAINPISIKFGFTYPDAQTDDARFTLELIDGALSAGAVCLNYCKVIELIENNGQLCGAKIFNSVDNNYTDVFARQIVNTTGQWLANLNTDHVDYRLTKGVHLIMPKILAHEALVLTAQTDGRALFMIPWYGRTLLGTTDTDYHGDVEQLKVEEDDIDYLLTEANRVLKSVSWKKSDIIGQYVGLRVLKHSTEKSPSAMSRDWQLKVAANGLLTSIGGKFTSAREDAAQIVNTLCKNLHINADCKTNAKPFPWRPDADYLHWSEVMVTQAKALNIDEESASWLIKRHAARTPLVLDLIVKDPDLSKRITPALPFIGADLFFCAVNEMVVHLDDLLRRRMPLLILAKLSCAELAIITDIISRALSWDSDRIQQELAICKQKGYLEEPE